MYVMLWLLNVFAILLPIEQSSDFVQLIYLRNVPAGREGWLSMIVGQVPEEREIFKTQFVSLQLNTADSAIKGMFFALYYVMFLQIEFIFFNLNGLHPSSIYPVTKLLSLGVIVPLIFHMKKRWFLVRDWTTN